MKVTLWCDDVIIRHPIRAAAEHHERRARLYLRVESDGVEGFGEVAPQPRSGNGDPSLDDVMGELCQVTIPQLHQIVAREQSLPSWTRVARFAAPRAASAVSVALVEMALLDREYRSAQRAVRSLWAPRFDTPVLATVSLLDDEQPWIIAEEAVRVRVKTGPGTLKPAAARRLALLDRPVIVDFNCSASNVDDVLERVASIASIARIVAVEQPYAAGNVVDHAILAPLLDAPLSLDEGVRSKRDLVQIARYNAARMVCIKPARVGGLANARTMALASTELGLVPYIGGFFESPFARGVHRIVAESCVSEPSDLAPVALAGIGTSNEVIAAPWGFELAPHPDVLERATLIGAWG